MADHKNFYYTKEHEWVEKITDETVRIGITSMQQNNLAISCSWISWLIWMLNWLRGRVCDGRIRKIRLGSVCACLWNSDETKQALADSPEIVNAEPFADGWMYEMSLSDINELDELLSYDEYAAFVAEEEA